MAIPVGVAHGGGENNTVERALNGRLPGSSRLFYPTGLILAPSKGILVAMDQANHPVRTVEVLPFKPESSVRRIRESH